jgi:hypothetical protein
MLKISCCGLFVVAMYSRISTPSKLPKLLSLTKNHIAKEKLNVFEQK